MNDRDSLQGVCNCEAIVLACNLLQFTCLLKTGIGGQECARLCDLDV